MSDVAELEVLYERGAGLFTQGRFEEAIACCDDIVARVHPADEATPGLLVRALWVKRNCVAQANDGEQVLAVDDELVARFAAASDPALRTQAARALRDIVWWSLEVGRNESASAASHQLLGCLAQAAGTDRYADVAELVAAAANSLLYHRQFTDRHHELAARHLALALAWACAPLQVLGRLLRSDARAAAVTGSETSGQARGIPTRGVPGRIWKAANVRRRRYAQAEQVLSVLTVRLAASRDPATARVLADAQIRRAHRQWGARPPGAHGRGVPCARRQRRPGH